MKPDKYLKKAFLFFALIPAFAFSQEKNVSIRLAQSDESYLLSDFQTNVTLKKKPFKFKILLDNVEGVFVFASIKDSVYRFTETSPIRDFSYLKLLQLREEDKFNANRELSLSEDGWSYWFYNDSAEWHSFNRKTFSLAEKGIVCTKAINDLYDVANGSVIKLRNINVPLYLFFVAVKDYDANGKPVQELMRRKVKIEWKDDD
jgi:hypothetical protein